MLANELIVKEELARNSIVIKIDTSNSIISILCYAF